jgi:hypothetical protein
MLLVNRLFYIVTSTDEKIHRPDVTMFRELKNIAAEVVVTDFKLSWHSLKWTEENNKNRQSGQTVSRPRFEQGTSKIKAGIVTDQANLFATDGLSSMNLVDAFY